MAESRLASWSSAIAQNIAATVLLSIFGVLAVWLAKLTPLVAKFAPLSYFFTFLAAVIVLLVLANLGVALFHRLRPPRAESAPLQPALDHTEIDQLRERTNELSAMVAEHQAEMEAVKDGKDTLRAGVQGFMSAALKLTTDLTDRLSERIEKLDHKSETIAKLNLESAEQHDKWHELLNKRIDNADAAAKAAKEYAEGVRAALSDLLVELKGEMQRLYSAADEARMTGLSALKQEIDSVRHAAADLDKREEARHRQRMQALHTVFLRECMVDEQTKIRKLADGLYEPLKSGENLNDAAWEAWLSAHNDWKRNLDIWLGSASFFGRQIKARTLNFDDSKYGGKWNVRRDQFPDDEAMRIFKKFRIIHQQWEEIMPEVEAGMNNVAFHGMTQEEARNGERPG
jgi:membrane protein implicated in regulation of membrane protease activity